MLSDRYKNGVNASTILNPLLSQLVCSIESSAPGLKASRLYGERNVVLKVFVTGGTGFIGHHLVRRLSEEGHQIRCLVRKSSNYQPLVDLGAQPVFGSVTDRSTVCSGMEGCDWLFHLANLYSMWEPNTARFHTVNVEGTRIVLEAALEAGVKKVVYVSTVAVYGKPAQSPFTEMCERGPVLFSEYARTKSAAEKLAWELHHTRGLPLVTLYPGIVLGAGDDKASGHYIQDIIRRRVPSTIYHNSIATYIYVGDVVDAMLRAVEKPETVGQKYLLGKHDLNGREFAQMISDVSGVPLPIFRFPDWMVTGVAHLLTALAGVIRRPPLWGLSSDAARTLSNGFRCDGSKAERELGIHYTPIRKAMEEAVASYRAQWKKRKR